ncbi:MAG: FG-GAP-like repeat-containing protein [Bryobacteraceae bacterium]
MRRSFRRALRIVPPHALLIFLMAAGVDAQSTLTFRSAQIASDTGIRQVLTADFNGDGNQDLVFLQVFRITVVLGNGDGTFQPPLHTPVTANPYFSSMAVGDFNNDGKVDVAAVGTADGTPFLQTYLGQGDGTFSAPVSSPSGSSAGNFPLVGDVNHDGIPDLIFGAVIALGAGDGTFPRTITASACLLPPASIPSGPYLTGGSDFTVADFKGDGNLDLSLVTTVGTEGALSEIGYATAIVCFGNGDGTFATGPIIYSGEGGGPQALGLPSFQVTTGDFNGDGKADVLVISELSSRGLFGYSTILGNGNGTFETQVASAAVPFVALSPGYLPKPVIADMNGDGKSDLIQSAGSLGVVVFLLNGDGTYDQAAAILPGQGTVALAVADFNNDGLPDIISSTANLTTVSINTTLRVDSVVNAASVAADQPVAPGSLVAIFGAGIGPSTGAAPSGGSLPDSMAGVSVAFNGIPAPLLFVSARQINAQVPWEISGDSDVVVTVNGASTAAFRIVTATIAPGVFNTGGQAFAFNSDGSIAGLTGTIAGLPSHPASAGDTVTVLANGLGPVAPSIADGAASSDLVRAAGSTPVFIGGVGCHVAFAGLSSTLVGVNQLNLVVPSGVHGVVPLQINAGGIITSAKVTIAVQ